MAGRCHAPPSSNADVRALGCSQQRAFLKPARGLRSTLYLFLLSTTPFTTFLVTYPQSWVTVILISWLSTPFACSPYVSCPTSRNQPTPHRPFFRAFDRSATAFSALYYNLSRFWKLILTFSFQVDATAKSNSGHPGAPMGMAPISHVLFNKFMTFNPKNPDWVNRDRFVLS